MPTTRYLLEIVAPTLESKTFESATPFMRLSPGDTVNFALFQDVDGTNMPLRVVQVEHMLSHNPEAGTLTQFVAVYTERGGLD